MSATLPEVILAHIDVENRDLFTAIPAIVLDVSKLSENLLTVQAALDVVESDGLIYSIPPIPDVPIQWPAGGGAVMTFPIAVGDDVLLVFSMRSIGEFQLSESGTVQPFLKRHHGIEDGYIIPSVFRNPNQPSPNINDVEIKFGDGKFRITKDSTVEFDVAEKFSVTNSTGELISLINDLADQVSLITVNTINGPTPINNKAAVDAINVNLLKFKKV